MWNLDQFLLQLFGNSDMIMNDPHNYLTIYINRYWHVKRITNLLQLTFMRQERLCQLFGIDY